MKAVAVRPGTPNSVHLRDIPEPQLTDVPDGRGVKVKVLKVGVDATDREINDALYGNAPEGDDYLVIGHECFGIVVETGPQVTHVQPGDHVTCTVRRPGSSIYDQIGRSDITSEEVYYERGINLLHGFMTEYFVDDAEFIVRMPPLLKHLHVLAEPMSCAAKAVQQAYDAQRRLQVWQPQLAYVMGAGQIGLLATLILKLRGLEVYTMARSPKPNLKSEIVADLGAEYISTNEITPQQLNHKLGRRPDLIIECTGSSLMAFNAMELVGHNGAVVWTSITGANNQIEVPADAINLHWVLGNKLLLGSVNANFRHFELGIQDLALGELSHPGVLEKILTNPVDGLENYAEMMRLLVEEKDALKVYINVADE